MNGKAGYQVRDLLFRVLSSFRAGPPIAMALLAQLFLKLSSPPSRNLCYERLVTSRNSSSTSSFART
nr:hypothetical protein CFP56_77014 [Quercus suber]